MIMTKPYTVYSAIKGSDMSSVTRFKKKQTDGLIKMKIIHESRSLKL